MMKESVFKHFYSQIPGRTVATVQGFHYLKEGGTWRCLDIWGLESDSIEGLNEEVKAWLLSHGEDSELNPAPKNEWRKLQQVSDVRNGVGLARFATYKSHINTVAKIYHVIGEEYAS